MNFIFDIGNVLINFKPEQFLHEFLDNPLHQRKMYELIFRGPEWVKLDEGTITLKEACLSFCQKEPAYQTLIAEIIHNIPGILTPIPRTIELLPAIKKRGHKLYYLSNYPKELSRYILHQYPFFKLFDGGVFSCDVHLLKPYPEIYRYFLNKYKLNPKDCVFFDDMDVNVAGAENAGIKGVLFTDAAQIEAFIG